MGVTSINPDSNQFYFFVSKGLTDDGYGSASDVMAAVDECVTKGAKIINMSLGGGGYVSTEADQYRKYYEDDGVLIVSSAGNSGSSSFSYPASYAAVMSVAAHDINGVRASFSQYNSQVEITGPGM